MKESKSMRRYMAGFGHMMAYFTSSIRGKKAMVDDKFLSSN